MPGNGAVKQCPSVSGSGQRESRTSKAVVSTRYDQTKPRPFSSLSAWNNCVLFDGQGLSNNTVH